MMKLKKLLKGLRNCQVRGSQEIAITGITSNSKSVAPGNLFIAKKGRTYDGGHYIPEAVSAGASAVATDLFDPFLKNIVQIIHPDVLTLEGNLAAAYYENPSHNLFMVGITGTNGKTTTSFIVRDILERSIGSCGLIGTIEYIVGKRCYQATHTTPDLVTNHKMLREMVNQGCRAAVMEVSSHALDQRRVDRVDFDVVIFSNLTLDHLDYHGTMACYGESKRRLFQGLGKERSSKKREKWAIVNSDSPWSARIVDGCSARVLSYGIENESDLQASNICLGQEGTHARLSFQGYTVECFLPLVGRFNVYNCLAAIGTVLSQGVSLDAAVRLISEIPPVRGRLQPVPNGLGLNIYVDFAHSDDALSNILQTLRETKASEGRLIAVFGCGGDRDKMKRPKMAEVCESHADFSIITSDNPRTEDPMKICLAIASGFKNRESYEIEPDRRLAIKRAIEIATVDDRILIAGKGHENHQIFAHRTIEFDDLKVVADICEQCLKERKKCHV